MWATKVFLGLSLFVQPGLATAAQIKMPDRLVGSWCDVGSDAENNFDLLADGMEQGDAVCSPTKITNKVGKNVSVYRVTYKCDPGVEPEFRNVAKAFSFTERYLVFEINGNPHLVRELLQGSEQMEGGKLQNVIALHKACKKPG